MYNVIRLKIDNGLNNEEIAIGAGNYIILQYSPVEVKIRLDLNTNPAIMLKPNSGIDTININRAYVTCEAVSNGEVVFLQANSSKDFKYIPPTFGKIDVGTVDEIKGFSQDAELNVNVISGDLNIDTVDKVNKVELLKNIDENIFHKFCQIINPYEYKGMDLYAFNTDETSYLDLTTVIEYENCPYDKLDFDVILYPKFNEAGYRDYYNAYFEILMNDSVLESVDLGYQTAYYTQQNTVFTLDNMLGKNIKVKLINKTSDSQYTYIQDIRINIKKYNYKVDCINNYTNDVYNITGNTGSAVIGPNPPEPPTPPPSLIEENVYASTQMPIDIKTITQTVNFNSISNVDIVKLELSWFGWVSWNEINPNIYVTQLGTPPPYTSTYIEIPKNINGHWIFDDYIQYNFNSGDEVLEVSLEYKLSIDISLNNNILTMNIGPFDVKNINCIYNGSLLSLTVSQARIQYPLMIKVTCIE